MSGRLLTLNAGSSSLKFALFESRGDRLDAVLRGQLDGLGEAARFVARSESGQTLVDRDLADAAAPGNAGEALEILVAWLDERLAGGAVAAVGHRIVHGGLEHAAPCRLDDLILERLARLVPLAPLHQPHNLAGVRAARAAFPGAVQVACFDTAFHRGHPFVNDTFALPRRFYEEGVRRYGFHGLSYEFITDRLSIVAPGLARGRVVVAHLGNGASMCAIRDGRSVGSTMGFSALDGLPMGSRCGQIDPGVLLYLIGERGLSVDELSDLLYRQSGLKGLSELSHDMRALEASDRPEARQAIDYFVFRVRRELGAMAAILGGLDALVFTGGIGENAHRIRAEICDGFDWLGIALDPTVNAAAKDGTDIAAPGAAVRVLVLQTDEEQMIARHTHALAAPVAPQPGDAP